MRFIISILSLLLASSGFSQNWESVPHQLNFDIKTLQSDEANGTLLLGGMFGLNGSDTVRGVGNWNGIDIESLGNGVNHWMGNANCGTPINAIEFYQNRVYIGGGGNFTVGDTWTKGLGFWDGSVWDSVPGGLTDVWGNGGLINDMTVIDNKLVIAGSFSYMGQGLPANGVAVIDGSNWESLYDFPQWSDNPNNVQSVIEFNNEVYIAGLFHDYAPFDSMQNICRYNGSEWEQLGEGIGGTFSDIYDMEVYNGKLYVCGAFSKYDRPQNPGNRIVAWNGSYWEQVANIEGTSESSYAEVRDMAVFNGELYLVGSFEKVNGMSASNVTKFDGTDWCTFSDVFDQKINQIEVSNNELYISGLFQSISGTSVNGFARLTTAPSTQECKSVLTNSDIDKKEFSIYPNPVLDELMISGDILEGTRVQITDILGNIIFEFNYSKGSGDYDMTFLSKGIYFIKTQGQSTRQQFIKL